MQQSVLAAVLWGAVGASALLVGAYVALRADPRPRMVGLVMGFGVGAMFSAIAYQLLPDATSDAVVVIGLVAGALTFYFGDAIIDRRGGMSRKAIGPAHPDSDGDAIFLGTLLDGIPESFVLGASVAMGETFGLAFIMAVFVSNLPEAIAATTSMRDAGESTRRIWTMWAAVVTVSALAAGVGFLVTGTFGPRRRLRRGVRSWGDPRDAGGHDGPRCGQGRAASRSASPRCSASSCPRDWRCSR